MGWTFTNRPKGMTTRAFFEQEWSIGTDQATGEFLGTAIVGSTFYAAVRTIKTGEVWALVCSTQRARGYYNFGYKEMDEGMGPNEAQMPAKLLDLLTPTDSQWANDWRARCRSNAHKAALAATLQRGDVIKIISRPLEFRNLAQGVREIRVEDARRGYFTCLEYDCPRFKFSLGTGWAAKYGWEIISKATEVTQ